jgi:hypothetical protein
MNRIDLGATEAQTQVCLSGSGEKRNPLYSSFRLKKEGGRVVVLAHVLWGVVTGQFLLECLSTGLVFFCRKDDSRTP